MTKPTRAEIDRVIVGNQLQIMRALSMLSSPLHKSALDLRINDVQSWWRYGFDEEVGFSSALGDKPRSVSNES